MVRTGAGGQRSGRERKWKRVAIVFMALTIVLTLNSLAVVQGALGLAGASALPNYYQVDYDVYDYESGKTYTLQYSVRSDVYEGHRTNVLPKLQIAAGNDQAYAKLVTPDEPVIRAMARDLHDLSGGDEETFTNLALQVAHQQYYSLTPQAKTAVESLVEASGDCDPQAVLVASLIEAADREFDDFDADVVLFLYWPYKASDNEEVQWGHMQVGVAIEGSLDDARRGKMKETSAYDYKGRTYHVAEPTFERGFNPNWRDGWRLGENWYPRMPDVVVEI